MREQENKPNNPQVFPIVVDRHDISFGLTLRDYFAGQVMQGTQAAIGTSKWNDEKFAKYAYDIADAMLKQREL